MNANLLLWPLKLPAVALLVVFALAGGLVVLVLRAGHGIFPLNVLLLLPVFYALLGSLALCAQRTLMRLAQGLDGQAMPGDADLNPFQSTQAFRLGVLLGASCLVVVFLLERTPAVAAFVLVYPLFYLAVALEESLLAAFNPEFVTRVLKGLNFSYLVLAPLLSGSALVLVHVVAKEPVWWLAPVGFAYLLVHGFCGVLLYLHRHGLELHTQRSPEQARAEQALAEARRLDELMQETHRLSASGHLDAAIARLDAFLGDETRQRDPILHERLREVHDERLFLEHGVHYLQRLAEAGELRKAWAVCKDCLERDERFRPVSDEALLDMLKVAGRDDARLVETLLSDFSDAYPASQLGGEALFRRARINIELLGAGAEGIALLKRLEAEYPEFAAGDRYQRYRARLRIRRG